AQRHQEGAHLRRRGGAVGHLLKRPAGLLLGQGGAGGDLLDQLAQFVGRLGIHGCSVAQAAWREGLTLRCRGARPAISRKLASRAWPCSEAMLSGWNWTPCTGCFLCCSPMMRPSAVRAVTARPLGRPSRSTISE